MTQLWEMRRAINEAQETIRNADVMAEGLASILVGRLRHVNNSYTLVKLKRELADFNAHTKTWKD